MKIIKFRVWNTKLKKFFTQEDDQRIDLSLHYWETTKHVEYPQQFTGLKDKNDKEIYDGDVINFYYNDRYLTLAVEWNDSWLCFGVNFNGELLYLNQLDEIEIFGNIYEKPELCQ